MILKIMKKDWCLESDTEQSYCSNEFVTKNSIEVVEKDSVAKQLVIKQWTTSSRIEFWKKIIIVFDRKCLLSDDQNHMALLKILSNKRAARITRVCVYQQTANTRTKHGFEDVYEPQY